MTNFEAIKQTVRETYNPSEIADIASSLPNRCRFCQQFPGTCDDKCRSNIYTNLDKPAMKFKIKGLDK